MKRSVIIPLLFINLILGGKNYYVKNVGNDSNTGLSDGQAWKTISKVNSYTFSPGDSICFNRGDKWREQLTINQSGIAVARISFTAYGTGAKPIINGADIITGWTKESANIWWVNNPNVVQERAMIIIDGVLYIHVATKAELTSANKYWLDAAASPKRIYVYKTSDPGLGMAEISKREYGIKSNKSYITVSFLDVRNTGNSGILFYALNVSTNGYTIIDSVNVYRNRLAGILFAEGWSYSTIKNSTGTHNGNNFLVWGVQSSLPGGGGAGSDNVLITHCYSANAIHDYIMTGSHSDGSGYQLFNSNNSIVEHCISENDNNGIVLDPWGNATNMICRYNYINNSSPVTYGIGVANYVGAGANVLIYYNIVINGASVGNGGITCWADMAGHGNVYVYNNTFYIDATSMVQDNNTMLAHAANFTFKNNIYYCKGNDIYKSQNAYLDNGSVTSDYNQFYKINISGYVSKNGTRFTSLPIWTAISGQDVHSQTGNPFFVNPVTDLSLLEGSPCIDKGVDVGLTQDYFGNPIVGLPDMGAIEYSAAYYNVIPVTSIHITGMGGATTITTDNGTLKLNATILPVNATNKTISWSIANGSGQATINATGLVTGVNNGTVTIIARANDGTGIYGTLVITISNQVIPVNQPPNVIITSPSESSSYTPPATITIEASALDPDGTISKVEFFNGSFKLGERVSAPYSYLWEDVPEGIYYLTAVATDNLNSRTISGVVSVTLKNMVITVNRSPIINITSPGDGKHFVTPATINITVDAYDPDGEISKVEYFFGTTKIGERLTAPYSVSFEITDTGKFQIITKATDNLNTITFSSPVVIYLISSYENLELINLFPNPNDGRFSIDLLIYLENEREVITIVNSAGEAVYRGILSNEEFTRKFDLSFLSPGIYILMVTGNKIISTKKFIKL